MSDLPYKETDVCCVDCGVKYLTDKQKENAGVVTANKGICCVCGKEKSVVPIRHYNYLKPDVGCRWVKASERLPEMNIWKCCKVLDSTDEIYYCQLMYRGNNRYERRFPKDFATITPDKIEWLSENTDTNKEQCPKWYSEGDFYNIFRGLNYDDKQSEQLSKKCFEFVESGFKKGWEKGYNDFNPEKSSFNYTYFNDRFTTKKEYDELNKEATDYTFKIAELTIENKNYKKTISQLESDLYHANANLDQSSQQYQQENERLNKLIDDAYNLGYDNSSFAHDSNLKEEYEAPQSLQQFKVENNL